MRRLLLLCYLLWAVQPICHAADYAATPPPEAGRELRLQDALGLALAANPDIAVAMRERAAIEGVRVQAALRPNPSVAATVEDTRQSTRQTTLQLSQPLELGDKRARRIEAAERRMDAAEAGVAVRIAEVHAAVVAAFYEVLTAQERVRLAEASLALAQRARDAASKRVRAGKVSPVEETKALVAESAVRITLDQAHSALDSARKHLAALWGEPRPAFSAVAGDVAAIAEAPALPQLVQQLDAAPALQRARLEVETRQALAGVEQSRRTPDLTVNVGARRNEELGLNQAIFGISLPIPVFDRNQGNLQEAVTRVDLARDQLAALRVQLDSALTDAWNRLQSARQASTTLQQDILPGARSAFDAASKGFQLGKFDFLDVLDAQRTLFQAQSQYLGTLLSAHQASADIERILGDVLQHDPALSNASQDHQP